MDVWVTGGMYLDCKTWSIDADLVKKVKHEAVDRETDASSVVEEAIRKILNKKRN